MSFDHRAHLALAHEAIATEGLSGALATFPARLEAIAAAAGAPGKFHVTLTLAWLLLLGDRMARCGGGLEALLEHHPELLDRDLPARHYRRETLSSERARQRFVPPDGPGERVPAAEHERLVALCAQVGGGEEVSTPG